MTALVKRNDLKYERNEIIALLAKALLEKAVSRNYVRGAAIVLPRTLFSSPPPPTID
jgi:hypothetical protein